jgi:hypothetical protein
MDKNLLKSLAIGAAAVVAAFGAWALGKSSSSGSATATVQQARAPQFGGGGQGPQGGQAPPGFGSRVTGAAASKIEKLVLARYPGTIEVVVQLPDGSYVAHDITDNGELHVGVSKDFKITGIDAGGPPRGAAPPQGAPAPPGSQTT